MSRTLTIVTYHYIRDEAAGLHALGRDAFQRQLDHVASRLVPVTVDDVRAAMADPRYALPEGACLLTFDDGYREHSEIAFPALRARGWQGVFFPVAGAVRDRQVLDVNRIQFALARAGLETVTADLRTAVAEARDEFGLPEPDTLYAELAVPGLHNSAEAMFVKRALQTALPAPLRTRICEDLFRRHVSADERGFADELYTDVDSLRAMHEGGMAIGGHGHRHERMNALDDDGRTEEFARSREFLEGLGVDASRGWVFCYPYGAHDDACQAAARAAGCDLAVTLVPRRADLDADPALALPRLDTNDLPY